jgi:pilus assembly protein CpaB
VIVPKQDIPVNTQLDDVIAENGLTTISVPEEAIVRGAITDVSQLEGTTTSAAILQGEQISTQRLAEYEDQVRGGRLGLGPGMKAVSLQLDLTRAVGGVIQRSDHVTIYATFGDIKLITPSLLEILASETPPEEETHEVGSFTLTLVPDVKVLQVQSSAPRSSDSSSTDLGANVLLTLELSPHDAQNVVMAQEKGTLWLGLLPPDEEGTDEPPVAPIDVLLERLAS